MARLPGPDRASVATRAPRAPLYDPREILGIVPKILRGTHTGDPRLRLVRVRRVAIESHSQFLVEADGEIAFDDARRLEVEVLPGSLRVLG